MRITTVVLVAALSATVAACNTTGNRAADTASTVVGLKDYKSGKPFDPATLDTYKVGETTRAQVIADLGEPVGRERSAGGKEMLTWDYYQSGETTASAAANFGAGFIPYVGSFVGREDKGEHTFLYVWFDGDGKMVDYSLNQRNDHSGSGLVR